MKASEALLEGMKQVKEQAKHVYYDPETDCACAIGCIAIGLGVPKEAIREKYIVHTAFSAATFSYPYFHYYKTGISDDNDSGMPLEKIAQRLEDIGE